MSPLYLVHLERAEDGVLVTAAPGTASTAATFVTLGFFFRHLLTLKYGFFIRIDSKFPCKIRRGSGRDAAQREETLTDSRSQAMIIFAQCPRCGGVCLDG